MMTGKIQLHPGRGVSQCFGAKSSRRLPCQDSIAPVFSTAQLLYGGTALRNFLWTAAVFGRSGFSPCWAPDPDFDIQDYCKYVRRTGGFGFEVQVAQKAKNISSNIRIRIFKAGTLIHRMQVTAIHPRSRGFESGSVQDQIRSGQDAAARCRTIRFNIP
jgi:hypothetical protein